MGMVSHSKELRYHEFTAIAQLLHCSVASWRNTLPGHVPSAPHCRKYLRAALPYDHTMKLPLQREAVGTLRIRGNCRRTSRGMTEHHSLLIDFELHRAFYRVRSNSIGRALSGIIGTIDAMTA